MSAAAFRADRPVVLVGLMGCGKSTVGPRLAARLALPFVDTDAEIESTEGQTAAEIFEHRGESWFRKRERELMLLLLDDFPKVIAAGGGAFVDGRVRREVLDRAIAVWLDADATTLSARIDADGRRPLLHGRDASAALAELAVRRRAAYAEAHWRIEIGALTPDQVTEEILTRLATGWRPVWPADDPQGDSRA